MSAVLLGTCHRVELIWWGDHDGVGWLSRWLAAHGTSVPLEDIQVLRAERAVRHLMAVTAGLESPRFGEVESQQQVKAAWRRAADAGVVGPELDGVFRKVVEASRQIRSRTHAMHPRPTLGQVASCAALERTETWKTSRIAIVGTGDAAASFAQSLVHLPEPRELMVVGRTPAHVQAFAITHGAQPCAWADLPIVLSRADVVLFAIRSDAPLALDTAVLAAAARLPQGALWVDLGMPPAVDASRLPREIRYVGLSDLHAADRRDPALVARAQDALQDELERYGMELHRRRLGSGMHEATEVARGIAHAELRDLFGTGSPTRELADDVLDQVAERLASRIVHATVRTLVRGHDTPAS